MDMVGPPPTLSPAPIDPSEAPPPSPAPSLSLLSSSSSSRAVSEVLQLDEPVSEPEHEPRRSSRSRTASHWIRGLQEGVGVSSSRCSDPKLPRGVTVPGGFEMGEEEADLVDEVAGAWLVEAGLPILCENWLGLEVALVVDTADSKALEPRNLTEAKQHPNWPLWEQAIREELDTLRTAGTWRLKQAPPGANVISSKWVFKAKKDAAGKVVCYKAQLVAQGFSQVEGVDYFNTYAPVAQLPSSHTIITMANWLDLELHQVDIKGMYLNGKLMADEVLYMWHPPGYRKDNSGHILWLLKSLYGLKQAGWRWYQKFTQILNHLVSHSAKLTRPSSSSTPSPLSPSLSFLFTWTTAPLPPAASPPLKPSRQAFRSMSNLLTLVSSTGCSVLRCSVTEQVELSTCRRDHTSTWSCAALALMTPSLSPPPLTHRSGSLWSRPRSTQLSSWSCVTCPIVRLLVHSIGLHLWHALTLPSLWQQWPVSQPTLGWRIGMQLSASFVILQAHVTCG